MKEFLTSKEAQDVLCKANEQLLKYPCLRFGQSLFNEVVEHYPKMEWIRGTRYRDWETIRRRILAITA